MLDYWLFSMDLLSFIFLAQNKNLRIIISVFFANFLEVAYYIVIQNINRSVVHNFVSVLLLNIVFHLRMSLVASLKTC